MRTMLAGLLAALMAAATARAQDAPAAVDLSPRWKSGQASTYRITRHEQQSIRTELTDAPPQIAADPTDERSTERMTATVRWAVTEAAEGGGGTATLSIDDIAFELTDGAGATSTVTIDKADEKTRPYQQWIAAISGKPITYRVDAGGVVTGVEGYKPIADAMTTPQRYDADYFTNMALDLALLTGGAAGRKVGDTWTHESRSDHAAGKVTARSTYALRSVAPIEGIDIATIERSDAMELSPGETAPTAKLTEAGEKTQIMFDTSRGEIVGSNSDRLFEVSVDATAETPRGNVTIRRVIRESVNTQVIRTGEE